MPTWLKYSLTIGATGAAAMAPLVTSVVPPPYNLLVSALFTGIGSLYHLFQPSPTK